MGRSSERHESLRRSDLFAEATGQELEAASRLLTPVRLRPGQVLVRQGQVGSEFVVLVDGEVEVVRMDEDGVSTIATLGSGDFVGEMALLANDPRTASVVAKTPVTALVANPREFRSLLEAIPTADRRVRAAADARRAALRHEVRAAA